jgi:olfactory receptor
MKSKVCQQLVLSSWVTGFLNIFPAPGLKLDFCVSRTIDHFLYGTSLLQISCTDTHFIELLAFVLALVTLVITLFLVVLSYAFILKAIVKFPSVQQRAKGFSACSSHMVVISTTYGSCMFMYMNPSAKERVIFDKGVAVPNISVAPLQSEEPACKRRFQTYTSQILFFSKQRGKIWTK